MFSQLSGRARGSFKMDGVNAERRKGMCDSASILILSRLGISKLMELTDEGNRAGPALPKACPRVSAYFGLLHPMQYLHRAVHAPVEAG